MQPVIIRKDEKTSLCDQHYIFLAGTFTFFLFFIVYTFKGGMKGYNKHIPLIKLLTVS